MIKSKKGFTLIEILISIVILAIIIPPLMSMLITSIKININAKEKEEAVAIAQKYIEDFKDEDAVEINSTPEPIVDEEYKNYEITKFISEADDPKFKYTDTASTAIDADVTINIENNNNLPYISLIKKNPDNSQTELKSGYLDANIKNAINIENNNSEIIIKCDIFGSNPVVITKDSIKNYVLLCNLRKSKSAGIILNISNTSTNMTNGNIEEFFTYIAKENGSNVDYTVNTITGKINVASYVPSTNNYINNESRLYKITITIKKGGRLVDEITAYKNANP